MEEVSTAITTAITSGQANVTTVVAGVIAMAAIACGAGMIMTWLRR